MLVLIWRQGVGELRKALDLEQWVVTARESLGADFGPTLARGRELDLEDAYALALDNDGAPRTVTPVERLPDGLTPRELDVLRLIAGGLTNNQAAAALVVLERLSEREAGARAREILASGKGVATLAAWSAAAHKQRPQKA